MKINSSIHTFYKFAWFHVIVNLLLFLLLSHLLPIGYETNDDTTSILISSGKYFGSPDAHLEYLNYIYGLLIITLYSLFDGFEWYTICLAAVHVLGLSIITWRVVNTNVNIVWKVLSILSLYMLEGVIVYYFQYTTTAALCATAAITLFITANKKTHKYVAVWLFTLASLIRLDPAFLVLLVCAPLLLFYIVEHTQKKSNILILSFFILFPLVGYVIDAQIYNSNADWKEYREFNNYRGKITDNPNALKLKVYPQNVDSASYLLLRNFFPDTKVLSNEKIKEVYTFVDSARFSAKKNNIYSNMDKHEYYIVLFGFFAVVLIIVHEDYRKKLLMFLTAMFAFLLLCYVSLNSFLNSRAFLSAVFPFLLVFFYVCSSLQRKDVVRLISLFLIILMVSLTRGFFRYKRSFKKTKTGQARETRAILSQAKMLLNEGEYVIPYASALTLEAFSPYSISQSVEARELIILSWLSKSPFNKGYVDSYLDLVGKNAICMKEKDMLRDLPLLKESILINYGITVHEEIIAEAENLVLIRLHRSQE